MAKNGKVSLKEGQEFDNMLTSNFSNLNDDLQNTLVTQYVEQKKKGLLDNFFGLKPEIYMAFIICVLIIIIACILSFMEYKITKTFSYEIWKQIVPIITLALGYIFGKKD